MVSEAKGDPFFSYHHINAFENEAGNVIIDLMCYDEPGYDLLTLEMLRAGAVQDAGSHPCLRRFCVDLKQNEVSNVFTWDVKCELPTINYSTYNTKESYT